MTSNRRPPWVLNLALAAFGLIFALAIIGVVLLLFPQFRPNTIRFTEAMGDIFYHQAAWMRPPENPNSVLAMYWLEWNEDGFRVPHRRADRYPVVALGDSFTEAPNAGRPWPDVLAGALNKPVLNLGFRGFGPREEMQSFELYGDPKAVETVVIGYFEGNDLSNVFTTRNNEFSPPSAVTDRGMIPTDFSTVTDRDERYPMQIEINGVVSDIAFLEGYIWALNGTFDTFSRSRNLSLTLRNYQAIRDAAPQACVIIAYFPDKAHIYLPYLTAEDRPTLVQKTEQTFLRDSRWLGQAPTMMAFDEILANLDNQRDAFVAAVKDSGAPIIDLTEVLSEAASAGEITYYTYDTHWNQLGHEIAGAAIAEYIQTNPCTD